MRHAGSLLCLGASIASAASESSRPRGVAPEFAKFYKDTTSFTCISNPSIKIPAARINDDYCDCPDGSDEPGTAACSYLSHLSPSSPSDVSNADTINATVALPGFYCKNKGHTASYVPFTNVNDGICDYELCCDGSDEWQGIGGVKCEDKCAEIGKESRKQSQARQKSLTAAAKKRKELVAEAGRLTKQVEDRIDTLRTEIQGSEIKVTALQKELVETERREKGRVVKGASNVKAGKMGVLVGLAKNRAQELREALLKVRQDRDASRDRVKELEQILSTFKEEYNPNFNDEGVKRAVRSWEDYAARDKGSDGDAAHDRDLDEITKPDEENGLSWDSYTDDEEESDVDLLYDFEAYLPQPLRSWLDAQLRALRVTLVENGILADTRREGVEPKAVTDARNALKSAEDSLQNQRNDLNTHKEDLAKDYGPDGVFRALKGTCVSTDSGEYTYELCYLDRTTQKSKKGGGHTGMGNYVRVDRVTVDEDLPADGRGLGSGERLVMKFENGQHCWNGPHRSTTAILACAEKDEIWKIVEEEKCVYRMEVGTPAVCEGTNGSGAKVAGAKDEL